jgi:molybdenum cofactor cytidylyltransferase
MTQEKRFQRLIKDEGQPVEFWAIVPAAGRSRRMTRFKPLLPWPPGSTNGMTVIESTIRSLLDAGIGNIIAVTGHRSDEVRAAIRVAGIHFLVNPDPDAPMSSSISLAMTVVPEKALVLILPSDHPAVAPRTIAQILQKAVDSPGAIIVPVFEGRRGHPGAFPFSVRNGLSHPDPDFGIRALMRNRDVDVVELDVSDRGILINLDLPSDYKIDEE